MCIHILINVALLVNFVALPKVTKYVVKMDKLVKVYGTLTIAIIVGLYVIGSTRRRQRLSLVTN